MSSKRVVHISFLVLFIIAECLTVLCCIGALAKMLSDKEIRFMHWLEILFLVLLVLLIVLVKVVWNPRLIGRLHETTAVSVRAAFVLLVTGVAFFCFFVLSGKAFTQLRHSCFFQFISYVSFYFDVMFVRPLFNEK